MLTFSFQEVAQRKRYKTPEEALKACLEVWQAMRIKRYHFKGDAYRELNKPQDVANCPCCEYAVSVSNPDIETFCLNCPMWDCSKGGSRCLFHGSPYNYWNMTNDASMMVEAIEGVILTGKKL